MLSLYIHWPFCLAKCPYCDFNSHVRERIDETRMVDALISEMHYWHEQRRRDTPLATIFFGGGTPSLLSPAQVARLIDEAQKLFSFAPDIEITLEANPTSSEAEKFKGFRSAGVNRLSLGVQAFDDAALKSLGREHNVEEAKRAIEMAQAIFPRHSFDLIYARKNQSLAEWERELKTALTLHPSHLSAYQLTIEPGTVFAQKTARGEKLNAEDDLADDMYEVTQNILNAAGLPAYEVSNHARTGEECRHNICYWTYQEYIGIGPGAHGRVRCEGAKVRGCEEKENHEPSQPRTLATSTLRPPEMWMRAVEDKKIGLESCTALTQEEEKIEALMMNLRLFTGIDKTQWQQRFLEPLDVSLNLENKAFLMAEGYAAETATHLRITQKGMIKLNAVTGKLLG